MTIFEFPMPDLDDGEVATNANTGLTLGPNTAPVGVVRDGYKFLRFNAVYDGTNAATGQSYVDANFAATAQFSHADVVYLDAAASGAIEIYNGRTTNGTVKAGNILTNTTRLFQFRQTGDVNAGAASSALTVGVPYLRQIALKRGTTASNAQIMFRLTPYAGGTSLIDLNLNTMNLGTVDYTASRWGDLTTSTTINMLVGQVRIATGADALDANGNLIFINPYTIPAEPPTPPSLYYATSATASVPIELYYATSATTSVRVDLATS